MGGLVVGVPRGAGGAPLLAVVRGAGVISSLTLPDPPAGVGALGGPGGAPALGVAAGGALYVYRNLRPFYKFRVPPRDPHPLERDLWVQAAQDQIDPLMLREMLEDLRDKAEVKLTAQSLRLLALPPPDLPQFVALHKGRPPQHQPVVTCLGALPRGGPEGTPDCPVLGTENGDVLILEPEAFTLLCQGWVPSPPAFLAPRGPGDGRCRLALACRDGSLYGLSRAHPRARPLCALGSRPVGLLAQEGGGAPCGHGPGGAAGAEPSGPAPVGAAARLPGGAALALLALETGEVRLYQGRSLVAVLQTPDVVTGLCFGRYGREDGSLLMATRGGALSIRVLRRRAQLGAPPTACQAPPPARLLLPPRTRLFVDSALREREDASRMFGRFQRELRALRLAATRAHARALEAGAGGAGGGGAGSDLHVTATVRGLGSRLRVTVWLLLPLGGVPAPDLLLVLHCSPPARLQPPRVKVPLLVPGLSYGVGTWLELGPSGANPGHLLVLVLRQGLDVPLLRAQVGLPLS
ncbi:BBSome complex member BBS1 [Melopsittacus undulatus]|uniref:BBSome complex member BBS1 n=1 Tax=Melopsittacus undulatus TaxID=13146 RepID=UPI00146CFE68|nr:Bardet-Biedl syndrome 1 protein [Melopsittacus undulatus]